MRVEFVIPSEAVVLQAQLRDAARNVNHPWFARPDRLGRRFRRGLNLPVIWQLMQDIRERLGMHHPVLDRYMQQLFRDLVYKIVDRISRRRL